MAATITSRFAASLRRWCASRNPNPMSRGLLAPPLLPSEASARAFSSVPHGREDALSEDSIPQPEGDLRSRIFRLRFPKRSATAALERWVEEGGKVTAPELRQIARELRRAQRYKHALEISAWMQSVHNLRILASDHAMRLDLILKIHGLAKAEAYFEKIRGSNSRKAACLPLLHCYVKARNTEKAENLMARLQNMGLLIFPLPFNEMMKLYIAKGQYEKVPCVIQQMKQGNIPMNVFSYNHWINACCEVSGISSVEKVFEEMANDKNVEVGWSTYATLANIYTRLGLLAKAFSALRAAEETLSIRNRLGYLFLITLYANLHDKEGVLRLWKSSKRVAGRITCANYMCIILCLVKVDDIEAAEEVFRTWESERRKYDIRVSNVLLGAYVRNGWMDKAESLHLHTLERGASPNYKTWEILMEGWVKSRRMDKAVDAMKKGFSLLKKCHWRPSSEITMAIAKYFEEQGDLESARKYFKVLRRINAMNLPLYKSFIRIHIHAQRSISKILKLMEKDNIYMDEEILTLVKLSDVEDPGRVFSGVQED